MKNGLNIELQLILFNLLHPHLLDTNLTTQNVSWEQTSAV